MNKLLFPRPGVVRGGAASAIGALAMVAALCLPSPAAAADNASAYVKRNLVSDGSLPADHIDPNLINPWGIAVSPTGMVWVAGNGSSASAIYDGQGNPLRSPQLAVEVPGGSPSGIVANRGPDFPVPGPDGTPEPSRFIFATEAGIISGWNPKADAANAIAVVDNAESGAVYKGIAIAISGGDRFLYATDFHGAKIDVFDSDFQAVNVPAGAFTDPALPPGFAPFGIQNINGSLYISYARQDRDQEDCVTGPGQGFVNVFDSNGRLVRRLLSRGRLNAPWGMALAPADFGPFGRQLLVANFGDGRINAYNPATGEFRGQVRTADNRAVVIDGLWGIAFGKGAKNRPANTLFFTAGPGDRTRGLYGRIDPTGNDLAVATPRPVASLQAQAEQQPLRRAKAGKAALQQVQADKGGEGEKPLRDEDRAALDAEGQGEQDEAAGHDADNAFSIHAPNSLRKAE